MTNFLQDLPQQLRERVPDPEPTPPIEGYRIQVSYPFIPPLAKESVTKAIESGKISSATTVVQEFETALGEYFNAKFVKACSSGYSALLLALKLARIKPGDRVLIPAFTMAAVVNAVVAVGARPTFVDCEENHFNPSVEQYEQRLMPNTTALIVTHTYGIPADCSALQKFCKANGLVFIEDIAEAIGSDYCGKLVGTFGDFACASLYANKTITAGDGGFVLSKYQNEEDADSLGQLMDRANSYANHGFSKGHHFLHFEFSGNYKISGLQASFATPAVAHIPEVMEDRLRIANCYRRELSGIPGLKLMPSNPYGKDAPWMFGVMVASKKLRTLIRQKLAVDGIETRNFFFPLHLQPMMLELTEYSIENLPNAESLGAKGFYLPTFYGMKSGDINNIAECLKKALQK